MGCSSSSAKTLEHNKPVKQETNNQQNKDKLDDINPIIDPEGEEDIPESKKPPNVNKLKEKVIQEDYLRNDFEEIQLEQ